MLTNMLNPKSDLPQRYQDAEEKLKATLNPSKYKRLCAQGKIWQSRYAAD